MADKIVFVDVDGVLNTVFSERRIYGYTFVDTRKVLRLRDIVERTGAQLVLSSTWRIADTPINKICYDTLKAEFERLRCPLWIDCTPIIPYVNREMEITAWLDEHPEVTNFVILDDDYKGLMKYYDHLVICDEAVGLTKERAEEAIRILKEENI